MELQFPPEIEDINATDLDIMFCLYREGPLWKMEITREVNQRRNDPRLMELSDSISKQAVSKRVERLHELDYLESSIISASERDRDRKDPRRNYITGYQLTRKGEETFERAIRYLLRDVVSKVIGEELEPPEAVSPYLKVYSDLTGSEIESLEEFVLLHLD